MSVDIYVKSTIEKVALCDDSDALRIGEILAHDVLYYGMLLQKEQAVIQFNNLLDMVGVQDPDMLQVSLERIEQYYQVAGTTSRQNPPIVFNQSLIQEVQKQFYGPETLYKLDQPLPYSDVTGEEVVYMVNKLIDQNPARIIAEIFRDMFDLNMIHTNYPDFFILQGTNASPDNQAFILAVMDDHSTLTQQRYYRFLVEFIDVIYDIDGSPRTLMVCPSVTANIKEDVNSSRGIYAMWDLSLVRFLHLLAELSQDERAKVKGDLSMLFAEPIQQSYCYAEGHALAYIHRRIAQL